jgi:hypothetical protein
MIKSKFYHSLFNSHGSIVPLPFTMTGDVSREFRVR